LEVWEVAKPSRKSEPEIVGAELVLEEEEQGIGAILKDGSGQRKHKALKIV
jgi:hypothetical protein